MLSRVAENLFWISRYVERAENLARVLNDAFHLELDAAGLHGDSDTKGPLDQVLNVLAGQDRFELTWDPRESEGMLTNLTFDAKRSHSLLSMISRARENARATQDTLSPESWSQLNQLYLALTRSKSRKQFEASPYRFYERVKRSCILFHALVDSTMPRSEAFYFLEVGRFIERIDMISRVLNVWFNAVGEGEKSSEYSLRVVYWTGLLRSCSAYEAYLKRYHERMDAESIVQYLVLDLDFPRSMRFCVGRCLESLRGITGGGTGRQPGTEAERRLGRLESELRYADIHEVFARGLPNFLSGVQDACARIVEEMQRAYFLN
jgi:uncharacterized alpha-E superfamily protein